MLQRRSRFGPKTWQYKESLCFKEWTAIAGVWHFRWHFWIVNEKLKRIDEKVLVGSAADIVFTAHGLPKLLFKDSE